MTMRTFKARLATLLMIALFAPIPASLAAELLLPTHNGQDGYTPAAAYGGDTCLVVWQSGRLASGDLRQGLRGAGSIVAVRVALAGKLLDEQPLVLSAGTTWQESPRAAFGAGVFLVVWHAIGEENDWNVLGARVSPAGQLLDATPLVISQAAHSQALPRVVFDGGHFVVVWQDYRSGERYEVYGARVMPDGKVLDLDGVALVSEAGYHRNAPAVASRQDGESFVLWSGNVRVGRGLTSGLTQLLGIRPTSLSETTSRREGPGMRYVPMSLAAGPTNQLAAWTTDATLGRDAGPDRSNAAIYDAKGQQQTTLWVAGEARRIRDPDVVWDGRQYLASWHEGTSESRGGIEADAVYTSCISAEGKVSNVRRLAGEVGSPAAQISITANGSGTALVAYERHPRTADTPIRIAVQVLRQSP